MTVASAGRAEAGTEGAVVGSVAVVGLGRIGLPLAAVELGEAITYIGVGHRPARPGQIAR